jgi:hypothetical protein
MRGILLDDSGDLLVRGGGLAVGDTDEQTVKLLFVSAPGEWHGHPTVGIGVKTMQNGAADRFAERRIRVQLEAIGFNLKKLNIASAGIEVDGEFKG